MKGFVTLRLEIEYISKLVSSTLRKTVLKEGPLESYWGLGQKQK